MSAFSEHYAVTSRFVGRKKSS